MSSSWTPCEFTNLLCPWNQNRLGKELVRNLHIVGAWQPSGQLMQWQWAMDATRKEQYPGIIYAPGLNYHKRGNCDAG
jgi:hypothetical protein